MTIIPPPDDVPDITQADIDGPFNGIFAEPEAKPEPMKYSERKAWGNRLREQAEKLIDLADRIDPEHKGIGILGAEKMATISTRWARAKAVLEAQRKVATDLGNVCKQRDTRISELINENSKLTVKIHGLEAELDAKSQECDGLNKSLESVNKAHSDLSRLIENTKKLLMGELPDEADQRALQEMDEINDSSWETKEGAKVEVGDIVHHQSKTTAGMVTDAWNAEFPDGSHLPLIECTVEDPNAKI